jgi:hypothetical protein
LDQSSFAAPQGLSQRTTSFIASQRQGIHQMLLRHLITLMIGARSAKNRTRSKKDLSSMLPSKTLLAEHTRPHGCGPGLEARPRRPNVFPLYDVKHPRRIPRNAARKLFRLPDQWWSQTGSNRRPPECKSGALPAELWPRWDNPDKPGGPGTTRTSDLTLIRGAL